MNTLPDSPQRKRTGIIIIGASGVGKGYGVGSLLEEYYGVNIFVTGDWCRDNVPKLAAQGRLADDDIIMEANAQFYEDHGRPVRYAFDCPREMEQAKRLLKWFADIGTEKIVVVHMSASEEVCKKRIVDRATRQGRVDDADPMVIERRLSVYFRANGLRDEVVPFLMDACNDYIEIDANEDLEEVRRRVIADHAPRIFFDDIAAAQARHQSSKPRVRTPA